MTHETELDAQGEYYATGLTDNDDMSDDEDDDDDEEMGVPAKKKKKKNKDVCGKLCIAPPCRK